MKRPIYLDYNATTPVDPRVLDAMLPYFTERFGNASSKGHAFGWAADEAVEVARGQVANLLGAEDREIVFTSGATEAANFAIKGVAEAYAGKGRHIVTVETEHRAVLGACGHLEQRGYSVTYLPVRNDGTLDPDVLEDALTDETILVAVMWANNEIGVLHDIPRLAERTRSRGILFMTDATQAVGKVPVSAEHVDMLVCSAHKFYGPKGTGALYVRSRDPRVRINPLIDGGGHEHGLRAGTVNVPGIVGMGRAAEIIVSEQGTEVPELERFRDRFESALRDELPEIRVNGHGAVRLPQTSNFTLPGLPKNELTAALRELAVSTGSACSTGSGKPSHVLKAIGLTDNEAGSSLRFSLGRFTTEEEVDTAAALVIDTARRLRQQTPVTLA